MWYTSIGGDLQPTMYTWSEQTMEEKIIDSTPAENTPVELTELETLTANLTAMFKGTKTTFKIEGKTVELKNGELVIDLRIPSSRDGRYTAGDIEAAFDGFLLSGIDTSIAGYKEYVALVGTDKIEFDGEMIDNPDYDKEAKLPSAAYINGFAGLSFKDHLTLARKRASQRILAAKIAERARLAEETAKNEAETA